MQVWRYAGSGPWPQFSRAGGHTYAWGAGRIAAWVLATPGAWSVAGFVRLPVYRCAPTAMSSSPASHAQPAASLPCRIDRAGLPGRLLEAVRKPEGRRG
jgi:hypothetical protein